MPDDLCARAFGGDRRSARLWGSAAAQAKPVPKWRWLMTDELHADSYNGRTPAKPQIHNITDTLCDTGMGEAMLDRLFRRDVPDECALDQWSYGGGKVSYRVRCKNEAEKTAMVSTATGVYDKASLRVDVKVHTTLGDNEMFGSGSIIGVRKERCG